jgi:hypothetical protein
MSGARKMFVEMPAFARNLLATTPRLPSIVAVMYPPTGALPPNDLPLHLEASFPSRHPPTGPVNLHLRITWTRRRLRGARGRALRLARKRAGSAGAFRDHGNLARATWAHPGHGRREIKPGDGTLLDRCLAAPSRAYGGGRSRALRHQSPRRARRAT